MAPFQPPPHPFLHFQMRKSLSTLHALLSLHWIGLSSDFADFKNISLFIKTFRIARPFLQCRSWLRQAEVAASPLELRHFPG